MDDIHLQDRIIQLLSSKTKQSQSLTKILQTLRQPKKAVNTQLYILQKKKRVVKVQESPPVWALRVPGNSQLSVLHSRGGKARLSRRTDPELLEENQSNLQQQVLQCLGSNRSPLKAAVIAKKVGLEKAGDVNPTLYKLLEDGLVQKGTGKPLVWSLSGRTSPVKIGACGSDGAQFSGESFPVLKQEQPPDQQFYSFQDNQLFRTDLGLVPDLHSSSSNMSTNLDFDPCIVSVGNVSARLDFDPSIVSVGNVNARLDFDPSQGDRNTTLAGTNVVKTEALSLSEAGGDIFHEKSSIDSENMAEFDCNVGIKSEPTFEQAEGAFGGDGSNLWNQRLVGERNNDGFEGGDDDKDMEGCVPAKKPRTFRDVFGLDGETSQSSNEDSLGAGMSPCQAENEEMQTENETQAFPSMIDDNNTCPGNSQGGGLLDSIKETADNICSEQDSNENLTISDRNETSAYNHGDTLAEQFAVTDEHVNSLMEEPDSEIDNLGGSGGCEDVCKTAVSNQSGLTDECNNVLKVLASGLGLAQFVLLKKVSIEPDSVQDVLKTLTDMGYLTGSTKLWKVTPEGKKYVDENLGSEQTSSHGTGVTGTGTSQAIVNTVSKPRPKFSGPPPSPFDILRSQSLSYSAAATNDASTAQITYKTVYKSLPACTNVLTTRSQMQFQIMSNQSQPPSLLSKPLVGQGLVGQSATQRSHTEVSSTSGLVPLMSLQPCQAARDRNSGPSPVSSNSSSLGSLNSGLWDVGTSKINQPSPNSAQVVTFKPKASSAFKQPASVPANINQNRNIQSTNIIAPKARHQQEAMAEQKLVIPEKFSNYPNRITSQQCLRMTTHGRNSEGKGSSPTGSPAAFKKGPPPSPMDILTKGLKKTEISPNRITPQLPTSVNSTSLFNTQTQVSTDTNSCSSLFSSRQSPKVMDTGFGNSGRKIQSLPTTVNHTAVTRSFNAMGMGSNFQQSGPKSLAGIVTSPASMLGRSNPEPTFGNQQQRQQQQISQNSAGLALSMENFNALNKNPISALMEYAQSRKMTARLEVLSRKGSSHRPTFEIAAFVGPRQFPSVFCHNKKDGKQEASDVALRKLIAEDQFKGQTPGAGPVSISPSLSSNMTHFDKVAALTHRGFTALVSQIQGESFAGRKVIAGLIMKRSEEDMGVLVSLGTGNRCITGQQLSLQGNTVNDSHAEIITRRGFIRFLYKQLLNYDSSKPHPMFEPTQEGKLRVRPNITFHLYISTAPCGDGALFSPRDAEANKTPVDSRIRPQHEPTFSSNVQGILRTKVEGGEGTIPIEAGFNGQTFDGIQRGERLRTMSCTDKICRWNVVGMQGALLSHFLEPVYLDSLTLGQLYDHGHLSRAVCCRVGCGQPDISTILPHSYHLNHPWLGRVTTCDAPREVQKTKAISVNWSFGDMAPEVTDGTQGLCVTSIEREMFSRCSKRKLFTSFKAVCEKFNRPDLLHIPSYNEAKIAAQPFVAAKEVMLQRFKDNGFGKWVSKPVEEEMFTLEDKY